MNQFNNFDLSDCLLQSIKTFQRHDTDYSTYKQLSIPEKLCRDNLNINTSYAK